MDVWEAVTFGITVWFIIGWFLLIPTFVVMPKDAPFKDEPPMFIFCGILGCILIWPLNLWWIIEYKIEQYRKWEYRKTQERYYNEVIAGKHRNAYSKSTNG